MVQGRNVLPILPKDLLSRQQRLIYELADLYSTKEIAWITAIPEKQVRQVFSVIRKKFKAYANKNVTNSIGAKHDYFFYENFDCRNNIFNDLLNNNESAQKLSETETHVLNYINRGFSTKQISKLTNKSEQYIRKIKQRLKRKVSMPYINLNSPVKEVDINNEKVKINKKLLLAAIDRLGINSQEILRKIGITENSLKDMMESGVTSYHNLFLLMKHLDFNPYGMSEKDDLIKKLSDSNWLSSIRAGETQKSKLLKDKIRYRNRVMYYGAAYLRYNHCTDRLRVENGRNGLFPLVLNRYQQEKCRWLLKKLMLKPVYVYKCPGINDEIKLLERKLAQEKEPNKIDKYKRELLFLKDTAVLEDGKALYIIRKSHLTEIRKILSCYDS